MGWLFANHLESLVLENLTILARPLLCSSAMEKLLTSRPAAEEITSLQPERKVAVVLNGNAKAVNKAVIRRVKSILSGETLFVSRDLEQWRFIARRIVNDGYDTVLCGGGDGTFTQCVSDIMALRPATPPVFGVLRLGTGNALASALGANDLTPEGLSSALARARMSGARRPLPMLQVEGRLTPFAGVGYDSLILEDYNAVKGRLKGTPLAALGAGPAGYAMAIAGRSIWRSMREPRTELVIRNEGAPAQKMDLKGNPVGRPVTRGEVIYKGPVSMAAASTIPYYGFGLKMFPQAMLRPDRFQLRVASVGVFSVLANLPTVFAGEFDHPDVHDYQCTAVSYHLRRPSALQVGGDEIGRRSQVTIRLGQIRAVWGEQAEGEAPISTQTPAELLRLPSNVHF